MPRIKRWFPVSHDINSDPEVWELTNTFGEWLLPVWLEILSVTDRADGEYNGTPTAIANNLARFSLNLRRDKDEVRRRFKGTTASFRAELALYWMTLRRWLLPIVLTETGPMVLEWWPNHHRMVAEWSPNRWRMVGEWWPTGAPIIGFITRNHWKYHRREERNMVPSEPSEPIRSEPLKIKEEEQASPVPSVEALNRLNGSMNLTEGVVPIEQPKRRVLDPRIKVVADRIFKSDPVKFVRLVVWIKDAESKQYPAEVIVAALEQFEPYAAKINPWYAYLSKIVLRVNQNFNAAQAVAEHVRYNQQLADDAKVIGIKGLIKGIG